MAKWLDNYNESKVTLPEGFVGMGNNTKGRHYSPAWGGQFQNGGNLWNTDRTAWVDSIHNARKGDLNFVQRFFDQSAGSIQIPGQRGTSTHFMESGDNKAYPTVVQMPNGKLQYLNQNDKNAAWNYANKTGQFIKFPTDEQAAWYADNGYKKGTGVLKKHAMGGSIPGAVGFTYARTQDPAPSNGKYAKKTLASAENGMSFYQHGLDWKPKSISKNGSVIKDDRGQWAHPGEITEIGSNQITMKGVDYPVLGISDTGDTKLMQPDQNYKFKGKKVTEYPMAQDGILTTLGEIANKVKKGISNWGVKEYDDKKSFGDAYSAARKEGQAEFVFKGNKYSTKYKGTPEEQLNETGITDAQLQKRNIIQDQLAKNITPFGYDEASAIGSLFFKSTARKRMEDAAAKNKDLNSIYTAEELQRRLDAVNLYTGYPQKYGTFSVSKYKPTISKNKDDIYYSISNKHLLDNLRDKLEYDQSWNDQTKKYEFTNARFSDDVLKTKGLPKGTTKLVSGDATGVMGNYTTSLGRDDKGEYISYYDKWDLDPMDFGKPMEIYDRVYLKDLIGGYKDKVKKENGGWLNKYK